MNVSKAIVCTPAHSFAEGITTATEGKPDIQKTLKQHQAYVDLLSKLGVKVTVLPAQENYPDSTFVEDPAVILKQVAVITNPGAESRTGETKVIRKALEPIYTNIHEIKSPGTLDGGDVFEVGDHLYIGLTERTNQAGAEQLCQIASAEGFTCEIIPLPKLPGLLHLKTAMGAIDENRILIWGELADFQPFRKHEIIAVPKAEYYAANCIAINGTVLLPDGYPQTAAAVKAWGYPIRTLEMSEFRKMDGGLSCLSLRVP